MTPRYSGRLMDTSRPWSLSVIRSLWKKISDLYFYGNIFRIDHSKASEKAELSVLLSLYLIFKTSGAGSPVALASQRKKVIFSVNCCLKCVHMFLTYFLTIMSIHDDWRRRRYWSGRGFACKVKFKMAISIKSEYHQKEAVTRSYNKLITTSKRFVRGIIGHRLLGALQIVLLEMFVARTCHM